LPESEWRRVVFTDQPMTQNNSLSGSSELLTGHNSLSLKRAADKPQPSL